MCFGSSSSDVYDAYSSGDYKSWENAFSDVTDDYLEQAENGGDIESLSDLDALYDANSSLYALRNKIASDAQAELDADEAERQYQVSLGKVAIDSAFDQFDDDYYSGYTSDYTDYYDDQVDDQYTDAQDQLTAALAGRGVLNSSIGTNAYGDLTEKYNDTVTSIANEAEDAANTLRSQVETSKSNLYTLNESASDAASMNEQALGQATALVAAPEYDELGEVFTSLLEPFLTSVLSSSSSSSYSSPYSYSSSISGSGSGRTVG